MDKLKFIWNPLHQHAISSRIVRLSIFSLLVLGLGVYWIYTQYNQLTNDIDNLLEKNRNIQNYSLQIKNDIHTIAHLTNAYFFRKEGFLKVRLESNWKNNVFVNLDSLKHLIFKNPDITQQNQVNILRKDILSLEKSYKQVLRLVEFESNSKEFDQARSDFETLVSKVNQSIQQIFLRQEILAKQQLRDIQILSNRFFLFSSGILSAFVFFIIFYGIILIRSLFRILKKIYQHLSTLNGGNIPPNLRIKTTEFQPITFLLNELRLKFELLQKLALTIGEGKFDTQVQVFGGKGIIGNAITNMRLSLKKITQQNLERNWLNEGFAKFGEILRENTQKPEEFFDEVVSNLVKYLEINQGGIFALNETQKVPFMELKATYAFQRKKYLHKEIAFGEGLIGQVWREKDIIYLTDIPEEYSEITSGLGKAKPKSVLITPLISDNKVMGILELASFDFFPEYKIEFIKSIGESIATTISKIKIDIETKILLQDSQKMAEQMKTQEDLMRQSMEELMTTQEKMEQNALELREQFKALDETFVMMDMDVTGRFLKVNELLLEITNFKEEELLGKHFSALWSGKNMPDTIDIDWRNLLAGNIIKGEMLRYTKDGQKLWLYEVSYPIYNHKNEVYKISTIGYDISKQKEQEQQIKTQLQELQMSKRDVVNRIREIENKAKNRILKLQMDFQEQLKEKDRIIEELRTE